MCSRFMYFLLPWDPHLWHLASTHCWGHTENWTSLRARIDGLVVVCKPRSPIMMSLLWFYCVRKTQNNCRRFDNYTCHNYTFWVSTIIHEMYNCQIGHPNFSSGGGVAHIWRIFSIHTECYGWYSVPVRPSHKLTFRPRFLRKSLPDLSSYHCASFNTTMPTS
jgi:hypothetical protein